MRKRFYISILFISFLFSGLGANAQKLSTLAPDGAVATGKLPDGLQYTVVTSTAEKGRSEYALLQRACQKEKGTLYNLRSFGSFSSVKGVQSQDSILFRMVSEAKASIEECDSLYGTDNQTLIIVGDVDKNSIVEKLRLLTYMVPASSSKAAWSYPYVWNERPLEAEVYPEEGLGVARVRFSFFSPRPKPDRLNTIIPTVSEIMMETLGEMTRRRLEDTFSTLDIPVAGLSVSTTGLDMTEGDQRLDISFAVGGDNLGEAIAIVSSTLSDIGNGGVRKAELIQANEVAMERFKAEARKPVSNSEWMRRVVSNHITGTDLASLSTKLKVFTEREIADSTVARSINNIAAATFGKDENILISVYGGSMSPAAIETVFEEARHNKPVTLHKGFVSMSSAALPEPSPKKVKPRKSLADKAFGGTEFQFTSGLRVFYKQMDTGGRLYWSTITGGGASSLEGALAGESAHLSDIFRICRINGFEGTDFLRLMESEGMTVRADVRFDDCVLSGEAGSENPELFFRFLLSVLNGRTPDEEAYRYYDECESLGSRIYAGEHVMDRLESELQPGYPFSEYKTGEVLADDFYGRAERYYETRFGRMNDGALLVIGDITEYRFLTALEYYADQFRTTAAKRSVPSISYRLLGGERTLSGESDMTVIRMAASGLMETTLDNIHAVNVADRILSKVLESSLKESGWKAGSSISFAPSPKGHVNMRITASLDPSFTGEAMSRNEVRKTIMRELKSLAEGKFQAGEPAASKSEASTSLGQLTATPSYWLWIGREKVSGVKDYNTGSTAKLSGLTNDRIKNVFSTLYDGGRIIL